MLLFRVEVQLVSMLFSGLLIAGFSAFIQLPLFDKLALLSTCSSIVLLVLVLFDVFLGFRAIHSRQEARWIL